MKKKILVLGDFHSPFGDLDVIEQAYQFNKSFKADLVLCTGDMLDQKAFSRYPKDPEDDGPEAEWLKAVKQCKEFEALFPKLVILNSNHDRRYIKKASEAGLPKSMIKMLHELIPCKKWFWHLGPDPFEYDGILFQHGDELQGRVIAKAAKFGQPVIQGHTHQASLEYAQTFKKSFWGMDVGCTVDPRGAGFNYSANMISKVWVGFGFVAQGVPSLVPKKVR